MTGLVILSYGFLISAQEGFNSSANIFSGDADPISPISDDPDNLTSQVARKLSALASSTDPDEQEVSLDKLQEIINDSISQKFSDSDLPTIAPGEIKIKKQTYSGSAGQIRARKKEDFTNYMIAAYYILSSSSPKPITNNADLNGLADYFTQTVTTALTDRDSSGLTEISQSGQKILDQLKNVEVPEDVIDIHTKAVQFAKYAIMLKPAVTADADDPLADLVNISKIKSLTEALISFSGEVSARFNEYGLTYDDATKDKFNALGITPPQFDESAIPTSTANITTPGSATIIKR